MEEIKEKEIKEKPAAEKPKATPVKTEAKETRLPGWKYRTEKDINGNMIEESEEFQIDYQGGKGYFKVPRTRRLR